MKGRYEETEGQEIYVKMWEFYRSMNVIEKDVGNDPSKVIGIKIETIQDNHAPIIQVCFLEIKKIK